MRPLLQFLDIASDVLRDLLRGLFSLPTRDAAPGCDYARELEDRYSKPRRCC
jgi:hypothetical protein